MKEKLFSAGARVAMVGDSITHSGLAVAYVQEYYLSHFPERRVKLYNLGTGGDSAAGATAEERIAEILAVEPTEAVVMFGVNDMNVPAYGSLTPTAEQIAARTAARRRHLDATVRLVGLLREHGLPVTLCSSVGRDEHTAGEGGFLSHGATDALYGMFRDNLAAVGEDALKNTVDYLTPMQTLQAELCAVGGPSLFAPDRTHPSELGQVVMARILLAAQGLPVTLPTAEMLAAGWAERVLPRALRERRSAGLRWRDLSWVYPHQADRTKGMDLEARIAFWGREALREDLPPYFVKMYKNYAETARNGEAYLADYLAKTDALYDTDGEVVVKEDLRI
jgi:lysophospholipase L1-like esterase